MLNLADEVKRHIQPLVGLKLSRIAMAADMRTFQFGNTEARADGGVVGQYALHVQCPWRLENDTGLITGNDDLYVPDEANAQPVDSFDWETEASLQERTLRNILQGYDEGTKQIVNSTNLLMVQAVQADSSGGFCLVLSGGYRFLVFPNGTRLEAWRIFKPIKDTQEDNEQHFAIPRVTHEPT